MTNLERKSFGIYKSLYKRGPFGIFLQKIEASQDLEILKIVKNLQNKMFVNECFFRKIANRSKKSRVDRNGFEIWKNRNCRFEDDPIYKLLKSEKIERLVESNLKTFELERKPEDNEEDTEDVFERMRRKAYLKYKLKMAGKIRRRVFGADLKHSKELDKLLEDPTIYQRNTILNYYLFKKLDKTRKNEMLRLFWKRYNVQVPTTFVKDYLSIGKPEKLRKIAYLHWLNDYLTNHVSEDILKLPSLEIALLVGDKWNSLPREEKAAWYKLSNRWTESRGRFQEIEDEE